VSQQKLSTHLSAPHLLPPPANQLAASNHAVPPPATSSYFLPMIQLPSVPTSKYQHPTSTDHTTTMHRQQNPPNVPIIELGELVGLGRDISWGEVTVGIQRYRKFPWLTSVGEGSV